jgi:hypothetical protein
MLVGDFELCLGAPGSGPRFPEVADEDGVVYAVARAGAAFEVRLARRDAPAKGGSPLFLASCALDARDAGHRLLLTLPGQTASWPGFVKGSDAGGITYALFRFADAAAAAAAAAVKPEGGGGGGRFAAPPPAVGATDAGRVAVVMHEAVAGGPAASAFAGVASSSLAAPAVPAGRDDKKKKGGGAPSLTTGTAGESRGRAFSAVSYDAVGPACAALELRYETAAALFFRGVLRREVPAHAAILDADPATRAEAPRPEVVDLAGAAPRALAEDFECDLTDEAAPRWSKRARTEHGLE